jgi:hypothetical protein
MHHGWQGGAQSGSSGIALVGHPSDPVGIDLLMRFNAVMQHPGVRRGVDLFASDHTGHNHYEKGDPDYTTENFEHDSLAIR